MMFETNLTFKILKKFAFYPVVCRGCGFIIHKESYWKIGNKTYHLKCRDKASENRTGLAVNTR